jgi:hypothetical protein
MLLKRMVPKSVRATVRQNWLNYQLRRCIAELKRTDRPSENLLRRTSAAWNNSGWSPDVDYLRAICHAASATDGPILECGSGLTTILLGVYSGRHGVHVVSLEHSPEWQRRIQQSLSQFGIPGVVFNAPLKDYGDFQWYTLPDNMPKDFRLVICDGPPGGTPGGRYGLMPLCHRYFASGCTILLDDAERDDERNILGRWDSEFAVATSISATADGSFATVSIERTK